jgi:hypothetical protein
MTITIRSTPMPPRRAMPAARALTHSAALMCAAAMMLQIGCAGTGTADTQDAPPDATTIDPRASTDIAEGLRESFAGVDPARRARLDELAVPSEGEVDRTGRAGQTRRPRLDAPAPQSASPRTARAEAQSNALAEAPGDTPAAAIADPGEQSPRIADAPVNTPDAAAPSVSASAPTTDTSEQREALIAQLARTLAAPGDGAAPAPDADLRLALSLAMVSSIATQTGTPDTASAAELSRVRARLSPQQLSALDAVESLTRAMLIKDGPQTDASAAANTTLDARAIAQLLDEAARRSAALKSLSIPSAVLCTRVEGFGRFTPMRTTTFLAARPLRAILYTEVDRFSVAELSGSSPQNGDSPASADPEARYVVHLGQQWSLYHTDGTLAWHSPEQVAREAGRTRPRDWFLTQRIELPATLSIGTYALKVTVRDLAAGTQAQRTIPITIVADPKLTNTPAR